MASEENLAENNTSSPAPTASQEPQAPPQDAPEEPPCPICWDTITDEASVGSCRHNFCFHCILGWYLIRPACPICQEPFSHIYCKVEENMYVLYRLPSHGPTIIAQAERAQHHPAERREHHPSGHQHRPSARKDQGSGRDGTPERIRSRSPRRDDGGHSRARSRSSRRRHGGHSTGRRRSSRRRHGGHSTAQCKGALHPFTLQSEMASEENLAENNTTSTAPTASQEPQAPPQDAPEEPRCPICLETITGEASVVSCRHTFCFICIYSRHHITPTCPICKDPFNQLHRKLRDNEYVLYDFKQDRPTNAKGRRSQRRRAERRQHRPSGYQLRSSARRDQDSGREGTPERIRSRSPRRDDGGHSRARRRRSPRRDDGGHSRARRRRSPRRDDGGQSSAQHAQHSNPSGSPRRQQSSAQDTAQVTGAEEAQSPRPGPDVPASSRRRERRQRGHRPSARERQPTRSRSRRRSRSPGSPSQRE